MQIKTNNKPELLAPAGDLEKLRVAFLYGADAVYAGVPEFGMRVRQIGFDLESLEEGIKYAHSIGKKVFVTVNIFANNQDIELLPDFLHKLADIKPDALIVADPGILGLIRDLNIDIPLHLSTQANVTNWRAAKYWHDGGFERIILAREVFWQDIKSMHEKLPDIPLEIFVHGAICMSYSGRCNISNYLSGRDANKGDCAHCCRWQYDVWLEEKLRPGELMRVEQDERGSYFFNSKDLCLIGEMDKVLESGAMSLKIEGRNKSIYYIATVVNAYRKALDLVSKSIDEYNKIKDEFVSELAAIETRGYTAGFFGGDQSSISKKDGLEKEGQKKFVGLVIGKDNNLLKIQARNQIKLSDNLEILSPGSIYKFQIKSFLNDQGEDMGDVVNTNTVFYVESNLNVSDYSFVRKCQ